MIELNLKPTHKAVKDYYAALNQLDLLHASEEGAVRSAFQSLLTTCAGQLKWTLRPEYPIRRPNQAPLRVDGALFDDSALVRGMWEAKDDRDDLEKEVRRKLALGYPDHNIIFQAPAQAILVQGGAIVHREDITEAEPLVHVVRQFFEYRSPVIERWDDAVRRFKEEVPEQARALKELIDREHAKNSAYRQAFAGFVETCRTSLNPQLAEEAVERMLIQHILTERIFSKLFDNDEFRTRNVVAAEIEKVVAALIKGSFNRTAFLKGLEPFYRAIELSATQTSSYEEKQGFLNNVYERFFQGFSPKEADTHGVVYTPQEIVNFMVRSVEEILQKEFGKSLADRGVHILDPFVGTGNFITRVMREIAEKKKSALRWKYANELHCNEIMLLPYYIAAMNIEHEYLAQVGEYEPFPGICLVDTFELAEPEQAGFSFMSEENTERVKRQKESPIFVIIGNPPYNVGQESENDNNKNRKYPELDQRIGGTYSHDSSAMNKNSLWDPYVRAIRWATDRIGPEGVVALVTNNSFVQAAAFDGMRQHLARDYSKIYHLNLKGDARQTGERRRREGGNIFDDAIRVSVGISAFVRVKSLCESARIYTAAVDDYASAEEKRALLESKERFGNLQLEEYASTARQSWIDCGVDDFETFLAVGDKRSKGTEGTQSIFRLFSGGVKTNRDSWCFNLNRATLAANVKKSISYYNDHVSRWSRAGSKISADEFVIYDDSNISWSRDLKADMQRGHFAEFDATKIRPSLYRPFTSSWLFFDRIFNEEVYIVGLIFPTTASEVENRAIVATVDPQIEFSAQMVKCIPSVHVGGRPSQVFPFYTYDEDGTNRRENITDWALSEFRRQYGDESIGKWDIFHYVYGVLHHAEYRTRYGANLKRELPRIPYAPDFWGFARAGARLCELHVNYEQQPEYPLARRENPNSFPDYRVEKMRLDRDKAGLRYNEFLTLSGIPAEVYEYRLGNRSALEWVIDQYQVSTDRRSGIRNDPNRVEDAEYIVRLVGQVVTVSVETVKIVKGLPALGVGVGQG